MQLLGKTTRIFLLKIENRITIWSSNPIYGYISWIKIRILNKYLCICTPVFIGELFTIVKTWKKPKGSSMDLWSKKIWCMHTMKYYLPLTKGILPPRQQGSIWGHFRWPQLGEWLCSTSDIQWVEATDAATHPTASRGFPGNN